MASARPPQHSDGPLGGERAGERVAVLAALLAGVLAPLNSTMIVVALPEMLADLDAQLTWGSWIIVSYLVAMAAVQPLGGALGDRFGRRRVMLLGLGGFALASLAAALAPSVEVLVLARTVQAITGASAIPNGTALVRVAVDGARLGRAFGLIGVGIGVAAALGPPLGGLVTDLLTWRWLFALNLLVLAPGALLVARLPRARAKAAATSFDVLGSALLLLALVAAAASATVWRVPGVSPLVTAPLAATALLAGSALVRRARRVPDPVLQLELLRRPGFLAAGLTVATSNLVMYTVFVALPLYLARFEAWAPREVGWLLGGMSLAMLALGPVGGALGDRVGRRPPALAGTIVAMLAALPFLAIAPAWPWWAYLLAVTLLGVGIGLSGASVQAAAMVAAGREDAGRAAGLFSTMRYAGSIVGTAALAAILGDEATVEAFRTTFALVAAVALLAVVGAARLPTRSHAVPHGDQVAEQR